MPTFGRVRFSRRGQRDVRAILRRTVATWGEDQAGTYKAELDESFARLRSFPLIGRRRDDLGPALRSFAVEPHVVFYRVEDDAIVVLRVVHARRDTAHLSLS